MSVNADNYGITNQDLYNHINDRMGTLVLDSLSKAFTNPEDLERVWIGLNDLSHIFKEGAESLVALDAITESSKDRLGEKGTCFNDILEQNIQDDMKGFYAGAVTKYNEGKMYECG